MFNKDIYVIDLETTGTLERVEPTRITEIGIVHITPDLIVSDRTFHSLVNPEEKLTDFIVKYTGLTDEKLANAPKFTDIADDISNFVGNGIIAAWPMSFECPILQYEYAKAGKKFTLDRRGIDIGTLATFFMETNGIQLKLSPKSETGKLAYSLNNVYYSLGLEMDGDRHTALADAKIEAEVLVKIFREAPVQV